VKAQGEVRFERGDGFGSVNVTVFLGHREPGHTFRLGPAEWASVVARVSRRGDTPQACQDARTLHDLADDEPDRHLSDEDIAASMEREG
jgi:hypothetical protein